MWPLKLTDSSLFTGYFYVANFDGRVTSNKLLMYQTAVWITHPEYLYHFISVIFMWPLKQEKDLQTWLDHTRQWFRRAYRSGEKHFGRNVSFNLAVQTVWWHLSLSEEHHCWITDLLNKYTQNNVIKHSKILLVGRPFFKNGNKIILTIMKQLEDAGFHLALTLCFELIAEIAHDFIF